MKMKLGLKLGKFSVRNMDGSTTDSTVHSSGPTLHRFKTIGHSTRPMSAYGDQDDYHTELSPISPTSNLIVRVDQVEQGAEENEHQSEGEANDQQPIMRGSFKFVKPDDPLERSTI